MIITTTEAGHGPAIVLLHGFPLDQSMWHAQRSEIGKHYRVITPDLSGHGQTPLGDQPLTVDRMADDVVELLDHLQIEGSVVIGGLSMGGYVALSIVARYPNRVRALLLINTRAGADVPDTARIREELARVVEQAKSTSIVVHTMLPRLFAPETFQTQPELVASMRKVMTESDPVGVAATSRALATRTDRVPDLAKIKIPTLVIAGSNDQLIPLAESEAMAVAIPGSDLVVIPDSGHLSPLENPDATNAAISAFLGRLA